MKNKVNLKLAHIYIFFLKFFLQVESHFDNFEAVELAVSYAGLSALTEKQPISLTKLKKRIESRFGFRLN